MVSVLFAAMLLAENPYRFAEPNPFTVIEPVASKPIDDGWYIVRADDSSLWDYAGNLPNFPERLTSTVQIQDAQGNVYATLEKPTRKQVQAALEKAKTQTLTRAPMGHTHTCPSCNITWDHQANPTHNCQQCGRQQTTIDVPSRPVTVKAKVSLPASPFVQDKPAQPADGKSGASVDALDEVNRQRAQAGLRPYIRDEGLMKAARDCAAYRAANRIAGHTNDFAFVPSGTSASAAGCAAWREGFGACCMFENWTYAGAAYVVGSDGIRYCHLYVR